MKKTIFILLILTLLSTSSFAKTKAERLKEKYEDAENNPEFHVVVDLLVDIASKVDHDEMMDAIYLFKKIDEALIFTGEGAVDEYKN